MGANKYFSNDRLQMRNEILSDILKRLSCRIEESLSSIIPEFTPLQCKAASLYEYPNVIDFTKQMIRYC